jgi:hypothetical protein
MHSERKGRYGSGNGNAEGKGRNDLDTTRGLGAGKRTRTEGLGFGDAFGEGEQQAKADKPADKGEKTEKKPADKVKDKKAEKGENVPEKEGAEAEGEEKEAGASGEGDADIETVDKIVEGVEGAVSSVLGAVGVPFVTHKTADRAPAAASNREKVGVGEMVTFKSNMPGKWKASNAAPSTGKSASGDQFIWMAMHTKGDAKITFDAGKKGVAPVEITMKVIEPTVDYLNHRKVTFPGSGTGTIAGVNMDSDVTYLPMDVSFRNTTWWEKPGPATGATGYFAEHLRKGRRLPFHNPNPDPLQIDEKNSGITDTAGFWDFIGPFSAGSFEWVIPTYYAVDEGPKHLIKNVHQKCTIDAAGTMTVTKESATMSNAFGT